MRRVFLWVTAAQTGRGFRGAMFRGPAAVLWLCALLLLTACGHPGAAARHRSWISLSPSVTEILYAVGAGPEVAGTCAPADYPPAAARLPKVASWEKVDVEAIVALQPEACFTIRGMQGPESLSAIRRLGVPVYVYPMRNLQDLWACMIDVGRKTGHAAKAEAVVAAMRRRVREARRSLPHGTSRAVVVVGLDPLVVAGRGGFLNDLLKTCGFSNALDELGEAYPVVSLESLVAARPDVIVFPGGELPDAAVKAFLERVDGLLGKPVRSVRVPADLLVRPGPRTVDAVERLCAARRREAAP